MNPEIKQKWLDALRSGEFRQGKMQLRSGDEYCCLGVLCELASRDGLGQWESAGDGGGYKYNSGRMIESLSVEYPDRSWSILPDAVKEWAGLDRTDPLIARFKEKEALSGLNDSGKTFEYIADVIEQEL